MNQKENILQVDVPYGRPFISGKLHIPNQLSSHQNHFRGFDDFRRQYRLDLAFRLFAEAKALELMTLYLKQFQGNGLLSAQSLKQKEVDSLQAAKQYLEENYQYPPTVEELARKVGINRRKLAEGFKQMFGKTIYQYIQHQRIETAKKMLQDKNNTIGQVAEFVGYDYQGNFTKVFQQYAGMSPRAYILLSRGYNG